MKKIFLFGYLIGLQLVAFGQEIEVKIKNLKSPEGQVMVSLFDSQENYLNKPTMYYATAVTDSLTASVVFRDLIPGEYAVVVFHDKNKNGQLDTNFLKIPKEKYGFSNNASGFIGPAPFEAVKFALAERKYVEIELD